MKVVWVLLLVTGYGVDEFDTKSLGGYDTMAQCYVASTQIFWERMPINQEALCIRVEYEGDGGDD